MESGENVANELRSLGAAESEKIRADADCQRGSPADALRRKYQGRGDAKASTYASAYGQNWSSIRSTAVSKVQDHFRSKGDVIVLDPSAEFFQYLK
jgi:membrane protease subunit HflC